MEALPTPPNRRSLLKDTGGAIYVEFLVVFIPFFIMVLGMMQIALMYAAHLAVQHSAAAAARAAIVVFPDCERRYDGAPQNVVNGGGRGDDPASILGSVFGASGGSIPGLGGGGAGRGGARLDAVRFAASFPMAAASPSLQELLADGSPMNQSIRNAIGGTSSAAVRLAVGALGYNQVAVAVNFPQGANNSGSTLQTRFNRRQSLTTRVTYLFHCGVPIVAAMACDDAPALVSGVPFRQIAQASRAIGLSAPEIRARLESVNSARDRLRRANWSLLNRELDNTAAGAGAASAYLLAFRGNFSVIRAEATLPLQDHQASRLARGCFNPSM